MRLFQDFVDPPGFKGVDKFTSHMPRLLCLWPTEDYYEVYEAALRIIDKVDPAVVVPDMIYSPAIDAALERDRVYAIITPNMLSGLAPPVQSLWSIMWRYPASVIFK